MALYAIIGTCVNPASSSPSLIAAIRPSIISEGATISAPASTRLTAIFTRYGRVSSFRISFPHTMPQCP